uniref:Transmembrane protein 9 n=1 Tax=Caenorhabditis japonica TaxID=281687 RepID=A0A8R1DPJ9_CAEJA
MKCFLFTIFLLPVFIEAGTEANFEDTRCRCICPSLLKFLDIADNATEKSEGLRRRFYTKTNIEPSHCKPNNIVKDQVSNLVDEAHMDAFLANCDCRYESRNTVLLKVVVIFVICVIAVLTGYMVFLMCLDPMLRKKRLSISYQQHNDEMEDNIFAAAQSTDDESSTPSSSMDTQGTTRARGNVLGRVEAEQNRWMKKVEEQRRNIFEDHTMLN